MGLEQFSLNGQLALVTGSSRGIGLAIARALGEAGATVVLNARTDSRLEASTDALCKEGLDSHHRYFDVTDETAVAESVDNIERTIGPITILVNNAGIQRRGMMLDFDLDEFRELIDVNLTAPFIVGQAVGRKMVTRGAGKIINIASVQAALGRASITPYTASKGGVRLLTQGMCAELAPHGIQVNALAPGYIATELTQPLVEDEEFSAWLAGRTPAGRWGDVADLGGTAVFLASSASNFMNGQILYVDGGMTAVV